ncbi:hypothetical protein A7975_19805 [Bacillus sp. FJAT-26390]|uniref:hypothetical protein n=1 Tax=Paenibacillus sp. FJAT-27812 TaxID=1684143 RepID=UPI0006A7AA56|nr:hypothetical protein [Paenibacillus sp. FJAT-27812]OBZ11204.1 hypothetical protein A7975_19805 [Bacillus sp. FJAT-26390]
MKIELETSSISLTLAEILEIGLEISLISAQSPAYEPLRRIRMKIGLESSSIPLIFAEILEIGLEISLISAQSLRQTSGRARSRSILRFENLSENIHFF